MSSEIERIESSVVALEKKLSDKTNEEVELAYRNTDWSTISDEFRKHLS